MWSRFAANESQPSTTSVDTSSDTIVTRTRSLLEELKAPQASDLRKRTLTVIHRKERRDPEDKVLVSLSRFLQRTE